MAQDPKWKVGDITLVSSDGVSFQAYSDDLSWGRWVGRATALTFSTAFADMFSFPAAILVDGNAANGAAPRKRRIEFTDKTFEDAETVRSFLVLVTELRWDLAPAELERRHSFAAWRPRLVKLIYFLDKWDSECGMKILQVWGSQQQELKEGSAWNSVNAFVFGALTNSIAICRRALKEDNTLWGDVGPGHLESRPSPAPFHLPTAPYPFVCALPPQYLFALLRASTKGQPSSAAFIKEFTAVVKVATQLNGKCCTRSKASPAAPKYQPTSAALPSLTRSPHFGGGT